VAQVGEREQVLEQEDGITTVRKYVTRIIETLPPRVDGAPYFMHGDPGLKKDSFTIAVAHTLPEVKMTKGWRGTSEVALQRVVVDFVLSWDPRPHRPVDLLDVDATILQLCVHYGIRKVTFDRWNSAQSIQALVANGIDADDMSHLPQDRPDAVAAVMWNAAGQSKVRSPCFHPASRRTSRSAPNSLCRASARRLSDPFSAFETASHREVLRAGARVQARVLGQREISGQSAPDQN
jgi:hypothetical protein